MQKTCLVQCGDQRLLCVLVFGPQFIYMWDMSRSYRPGPKIHLVCFPQTLNTMKFHQFPSNSLYFPMFPLLSLTPFFSTPYNVHLFLLLQSLLSRGVIITSPLDTFPYLSEFPRILTTLEASLGTFQMSISVWQRIPQSHLIVFSSDLNLAILSRLFLWLACRYWAQLGLSITLFHRGLLLILSAS